VSQSCPSCGAATPSGAAFCESCGAKLSVAEPPSRTGRRRWLIFGLCAAILLVAGIAGGYLLGTDAADDSSEVDALEERVQQLADERDEAVDRADSAEEEVESLNDRLDAELGFSEEDSTQRDEVVSAADADLQLGEAGRVGDLLLRPTSFVKTGEGTEAAIWVATISAKNEGSRPVGPFCGGAGADLRDSEGRRFGGDSVIGNTRNCGDDLQPGLSADNYKMRFKLPKDAQPMVLRLVDEFTFSNAEKKTWAVG